MSPAPKTCALAQDVSSDAASLLADDRHPTTRVEHGSSYMATSESDHSSSRSGGSRKIALWLGFFWAPSRQNMHARKYRPGWLCSRFEKADHYSFEQRLRADVGVSPQAYGTRGR